MISVLDLSFLRVFFIDFEAIFLAILNQFHDTKDLPEFTGPVLK